jgi:L-threonylcarbamoyladenylate synthase
MDSSTPTPPYRRLFKQNKSLTLRERTGTFAPLLSLFPVDVSLQVDEAVRRLSAGEAVGMPTETVYGLAASISSERALRSVFKVKERPFFDPLIVHISSLDMLSEVTASWPKLCQRLAEEFWPGPLTIVTERHGKLNPLITSGLETVAVRMPAHPVSLAMIARLGTPVAAPSANKFGKTSPTSSRHVRESFPELFVVEGGDSEIGLESTVVRVEGDRITLLRPGFVTLEELRAAVGAVATTASGAAGGALHSPGRLEHHYQPDVPLILIGAGGDLYASASNGAGAGGRASRDTGMSTEPARAAEASVRIAEVNVAEASVDIAEAVRALGLPEGARAAEVVLDDDPLVSARLLYARLREASGSGADYLICYWKPEWNGGLWEAIADRLKKAATLRYR